MLRDVPNISNAFTRIGFEFLFVIILEISTVCGPKALAQPKTLRLTYVDPTKGVYMHVYALGME